MLAGPIEELLKRVEGAERAHNHRVVGDSILEVNRIIAKAAGFYEKVRYLIDYREEHTIRRAAIERILKRRVFIEQNVEVGMMLLQELADGQYLEGQEATEEIATEIDKIVWRFLGLIEAARVNGKAARALVSFAATEIDALLSPHQYAVDQASVEAFYKTLKGHVVVAGVSEEVVNAQLYCACWRTLLAADNERLSHALWLLYVPEWQSSDVNIENVAPKLSAILTQIEHATANQLQWQLAPKIKNESIYFHIIRDIVQEHGAAAEYILRSETEFETHVRAFLERRYAKENERIRTSGVRAVMYLFLTKIAVALIVEVPYEIIFLGAISTVPLAINALFHPTLLFVLTRGVGALDESNTQVIISGVKGIVYGKEMRAVRVRSNYSRLTFAFGVLYLILVLFVFGALIGMLQLLGFNVVSIILFLFFLALVSYFAFRIRYRAQRWKIATRQRTLSVVASVLAIPVVRTGRWLSQTFSSINIFVMILDFIIETPFKRLLNFSNQFLFYLREKAEEIR